MPVHPVNILLVNSGDSGGGAEEVASELLRSYQLGGHEAWLAVGRKVTRNERVIPLHHERQRSSLTRATGRWLGHEDFAFPGIRHLLESTLSVVDLVHCHNLHGNYFDLRFLSELSMRVPVVVTLHDAWMLSGHCAHSFGCERWKTGCGRCPDLAIYPAIRRDATAYNWRRKRTIYAASRLHIATPSRWLMEKVNESVLAPAIQSSRVIPNGIDLTIFSEGDRGAARAVLGLPQTGRIVLFAANGIRQNPFKDYETLRTALAIAGKQFAREKITLVGLGESGTRETVGGVDICFVPFEADRMRVAAYYRAADVYVHAAKAETFPNATLEAGACGTPVIASAVGGLVEQVLDGRTGFVVPACDPIAMAARLVQLLRDDGLRKNIGSRAAVEVRARYGKARMTKDYLEWFGQILAAEPTKLEDSARSASAPWNS